jgi:hypothetical protein
MMIFMISINFSLEGPDKTKKIFICHVMLAQFTLTDLGVKFVIREIKSTEIRAKIPIYL